MDKLYYSMPMRSTVENNPCLKLFWTCPCKYNGLSNFKLEYLIEFATEFDNILGYESRAQVGSLDEKSESRKNPFTLHMYECDA
jgi:hypothetical protein